MGDFGKSFLMIIGGIFLTPFFLAAVVLLFRLGQFAVEHLVDPMLDWAWTVQL